ncbi:MAG: ABC transporter substrate-binding protein [Treponema sp.]|nr:ABC transporter substrate-binding protein [Treponema sp.]
MNHNGYISSLLKRTCLALACAGLLFSCSSQKTTAGSGDDLSHHVIITCMTTGDRPTNGATEKMLKELNKILTEKINAEIQMYYIPWSDYLFNYDVTLAQMDGTVDLVGTASDWLDAWQNAKNGTFLGMSDEMVKKYAPKTYESVSAAHWDMCRMGGKIYMMPEDNYAQWINHGFMYRIDWAKEAGLPNGVHSWEDLTTYFRYIKTSKPDVAGWNANGELSSFHADGYIESKSDYVPLEGITTLLLFGVRRSNLKKIYSPFLEGTELVEYAKLMREWNNMGVWPSNVLYNAGSDSRGDFKEGRASVDQHHSQTWYTEVVPAIRKNFPNADCGFFWFGEEAGNVTSMTITHGAMAISAASKNPERALMVYDLIRNDPQCYALFNYGIEGVQYKLGKDGYREKIEGSHGISTNFWWGRNDALELRDRNGAWDKFSEISAIYDKTKIDYPYPQIIWNADNISSELSALSDIWGKYMGNICFGQKANPEAYVAEFRSALIDAGIDTVIADLQRQLDQYNSSR